MQVYYSKFINLWNDRYGVEAGRTIEKLFGATDIQRIVSG